PTGRIGGAGEGRGARRIGRAELHARRPVERQARHGDRGVPTARIQRARDGTAGAGAHGGREVAVSGRSGLRGVAGHDAGGDGGDRGDRQDAVRGAGAGDRGGVHLPAGVPGDADPAAGGAGLASGDVRGVSIAGVFDQHAVAVRAGAGDRAGGGRRDRGGGGGGAPHRRGAEPTGCDAPGDGGRVGAGGGDRVDPGGGGPARGGRGRGHRAGVPAG